MQTPTTLPTKQSKYLKNPLALKQRCISRKEVYNGEYKFQNVQGVQINIGI